MVIGRSMESGLVVRCHVNKEHELETEPAITHHLVQAVSRAVDRSWIVKSVTLANVKVLIEQYHY